MLPTLETIKDLSPGACKLLLALQHEPDADNWRLAALTGYTVRQVRNLRKQLGPVKFDQQRPPCQAELTDEQRQTCKLLVKFDFDQATARKIAIEFEPANIQAGIDWVMGISWARDRRAVLLWWLRQNKSVEYHGSEFSPYARFWDHQD